MLYLHDVWVNWFEGEENGCNVCPFHEWRKDDGMMLLDQVPVVIVREQAMDYIENTLGELPEDLLKKIENKAFIRKGSKREMMEYCFIASDGNRTMAIETMGYRVAVKKSRIMPQHELIVREMADCHASEPFYFPEMDKKTYSLTEPSPEWMTGLTRKERQLKQLLLLAVDQLIESGNEHELKYWFTEWAPDRYESIRQMEWKEAADQFSKAVTMGWSARHEQVCSQIIKGRPFFEKMYEHEMSFAS
ncbi:DUF3603 family protein [Domibacillus epiphyticus]|uniref:Uncharacterized protein n=1 Tax=Domibacillus epiphyticus TaxID=1714355 RepID=A0A1V2A7X8_9BACI|nr:DUF3603 family protein [Domibacillus epiphyticus]OMP67098.1 hypothetical protein BTO28_08955 [Domibacillus epiphyticus]